MPCADTPCTAMLDGGVPIWKPGNQTMRFFNTAGPVKPDDHYCIPPLERFDLEEVLALVRMKKYFVLHAPRQTGKTSALLALRDLLNGQGYACVYTTVEEARTARDDMVETMRVVLSGVGSDARSALGDDFLARHWSGILAEFGPNRAFREALKRWSEASPKPLVLLIDEIDTLQGDPLLSMLQQLRGGLSHAPGRLSAVRGAVRAARRARLPHPLHQQPLQHRGEVAAAR